MFITQTLTKQAKHDTIKNSMKKYTIMYTTSPEKIKKIMIYAFILAIILSLILLTNLSIAVAKTLEFTNSLPDAKDKVLVKVNTLIVPVTAYTSEAAQTDATPCITANGYNLCKANEENVIAANFLPFGTMVKFPDYDPDTIFTVQDRMNKRYPYRADIWMIEKSDAIQFGVKKLTMEVYQYGNN